MSRKWWDSLTDSQKRAHRMRSAVGLFKRNVRELESIEKRWGPLAPHWVDMVVETEQTLLLAESMGDGLPLSVGMEVRDLRERLVALRLRAEKGTE